MMEEHQKLVEKWVVISEDRRGSRQCHISSCRKCLIVALGSLPSHLNGCLLRLTYLLHFIMSCAKSEARTINVLVLFAVEFYKYLMALFYLSLADSSVKISWVNSSNTWLLAFCSGDKGKRRNQFSWSWNIHQHCKCCCRMGWKLKLTGKIVCFGSSRGILVGWGQNRSIATRAGEMIQQLRHGLLL